MATRIQLRRDTAANWVSANPTLTAGELGYETDTYKIKLGTGSTAWNSLPYIQIALGTDTTGNYVATVTGTANQVSVSGSGSENAALTLSLPQDINTSSSPTFGGATLDAIRVGITAANEIDTTAGNLTIDSAGGTVTVDDNLIVSGDLTVSGTTTTVNTETINLADNIIVLNANATGAPTENAGIEVERGDSANVVLRWNESTDTWEATRNGTDYYALVLAGDDIATSDITNFTENVQDVVGGMVSTNTESGISVTYDDANGKLNFDVADPTLTFTGDATGSGTITNLGNTSIELTVADNSHNHTSSNISDFTESVQDVVGGMVSTNTESGISVTYDDTNGKLDFNVNDPTISLTGDVTGSATMTDLGNVSIATTIAANSVALGTDTTGNYIATVSGTDGVSVTGSGSENAAVTIANTDKGSSQNIFKNVAVSGQSDIVADSNNDTITFAGGTGITLTTNATTDTLTVTNSGVTSLSGTANRVTVSGSTGSVTISAPQDIHTSANPTFAGATLDSVQVGITTAGEIDTIAGNLTLDSAGGTVLVDDNLSVTGDLTVNGTTTTVNSTTVTVDDPIITLGGDTAPTVDDNKDRGIEFRYFDTAARLGFMGYDDSAGQFVFLTAATNTSEVFSGTKGTIDANISGSNINAGTVSATYIDSAIARLASPTFTGTPSAPTAAADTNTTQVATTAFVVGQAGSATPLVNGTAAVGTSLRYARQDHVHGTDTTRAPLASPALTGTPTAPTAAVDTNTTQIATTAYVIGQGYLKSATASSTYAPLASPTFTGTTTIPTLTLTTADTATTASHYFVETASDGIVRPKTLANVRTEIVTTAAVNSAAATTVGTVTSGTWAATDVALDHGGTNASLTAVNGGVVYSTASAMAITSAGTAGQVLTSNGASAPTWQTPSSGGFDAFLLAGM